MGHQGTKLYNFTPLDRVDELETIDMEVGTGALVQQESNITVHYTGALAKNGIIFQSSFDTGRTFSTPLSEVVAGWQQGLLGMKVGGTRRLIIPSDLAYGADSPAKNVPAHSDLVFDIDLIAVRTP